VSTLRYMTLRSFYVSSVDLIKVLSWKLLGCRCLCVRMLIRRFIKDEGSVCSLFIYLGRPHREKHVQDKPKKDGEGRIDFLASVKVYTFF
jgi:hypothetical protein